MKINLLPLTKKQTIEKIKSLIKLKGKYICLVNLDTIYHLKNKKFEQAIQQADLLVSDGFPIAKISGSERFSGPDLMLELINKKYNYKHFFYGSTKQTLKKLTTKLKKLNPKIKMTGTYSPDFDNKIKLENEKIIEKINKASPDIIWIGLGCPKQELWMNLHKQKITATMIGVGAAFDFLSGNKKRAPIILQKLNLEWLYRLIQEPKRLWKRYLLNYPQALFYLYKIK